MNHPSGQSSPRASGVRGLTIILLGLFFAAVVIFIFLSRSPLPERALSRAGQAAAEKPMGSTLLSEASAPEILQEKDVAEKSVYTLSEVALEPELLEIPGAGEADQKKLGYNLGIEDVTGRGNVRASNLKIGVDYKVSKNSSVGIEARQGVHDTQDAAAWGASVDDETAARAKYKLSF